jgi:hypothetical protein
MKMDRIEKLFYEKGALPSFEEIREKALLFIDYAKLTNEDLYDYWFGIADNWDLNIYIWEEDTGEENLYATLHKVVDGVTTNEFYRIYQSEWRTANETK